MSVEVLLRGGPDELDNGSCRHQSPAGDAMVVEPAVRRPREDGLVDRCGLGVRERDTRPEQRVFGDPPPGDFRAGPVDPVTLALPGIRREPHPPSPCGEETGPRNAPARAHVPTECFEDRLLFGSAGSE